MHKTSKKKTLQNMYRWTDYGHAIILIDNLSTSLKKSHFLTPYELYMLELYISPLYDHIASAFKLEADNE